MHRVLIVGDDSLEARRVINALVDMKSDSILIVDSVTNFHAEMARAIAIQAEKWPDIDVSVQEQTQFEHRQEWLNSIRKRKTKKR